MQSSDMQIKRRQIWRVVAYAVGLILNMSVVFFAGLEYADNRKFALSSLILACLGVINLVLNHAKMIRNQQP